MNQEELNAVFEMASAADAALRSFDELLAIVGRETRPGRGHAKFVKQVGEMAAAGKHKALRLKDRVDGEIGYLLHMKSQMGESAWKRLSSGEAGHDA